jgi:hypothetical protein
LSMVHSREVIILAPTVEYVCVHTWLYCSRSSTEERIWNGVWLVSFLVLPFWTRFAV